MSTAVWCLRDGDRVDKSAYQAVRRVDALRMDVVRARDCLWRAKDTGSGDADGNDHDKASAQGTGGGAIADPAAASEPDLDLSTHPAPEHPGHCHWHNPGSYEPGWLNN